MRLSLFSSALAVEPIAKPVEETAAPPTPSPAVCRALTLAKRLVLDGRGQPLTHEVSGLRRFCDVCEQLDGHAAGCAAVQFAEAFRAVQREERRGPSEWTLDALFEEAREAGVGCLELFYPLDGRALDDLSDSPWRARGAINARNRSGEPTLLYATGCGRTPERALSDLVGVLVDLAAPHRKKG